MTKILSAEHAALVAKAVVAIMDSGFHIAQLTTVASGVGITVRIAGAAIGISTQNTKFGAPADEKKEMWGSLDEFTQEYGVQP